MMMLRKQNLRKYLIEKKQLEKQEKPIITYLQGGNANIVLRVKTKTKEFVVKQTLEEPINKNMFLERIKFDRKRALLEVKTMQKVHELLKEPHVPRLLFYDQENYVMIMSAVPEHAKLYQSELFEGKVHAKIAAGLGRFTAALHSATYCNSEIQSMFQETIGRELREYTITPAFDKYPRLKKELVAAFEKSKRNKFCLVDADITHKNILLHDGTFTKIDFELMHYGDPALDVGIVLAHYFLPVFIYSQWQEEYLSAAEEYWNAYQKHVQFKLPKQFFTNMKNYMAMMMLGRVDSAVVLPWLDGKQNEIRTTAIKMFKKDCNSLKDAYRLFESSIPK